MITEAQHAVRRAYRSERRFGYQPLLAAHAVVDCYARVIADLVVQGVEPSQCMVDEYRVAQQWAEQVRARGRAGLSVAS